MKNYNQTIILHRGDHTSLTINLIGGRVTSWRIQNREQLFVSKIAAYSHLIRLRGGIGLSFPHFKEWDFGPNNGFSKNMMWTSETGPQYHENGDVWAAFSLKDNYYTQSIWNFKFKLYFTVTLHEFEISFNISVENYDDHFTFEFYFLHHAFFRTPDVNNCEITGLKNTLFRVNKQNDYKFDEADIMEEETRDVIKIIDGTNVVYTNVFENLEISNMMDNGTLTITSEGTHDLQLSSIGKNHNVRYIGKRVLKLSVHY